MAVRASCFYEALGKLLLTYILRNPLDILGNPLEILRNPLDIQGNPLEILRNPLDILGLILEAPMCYSENLRVCFQLCIYIYCQGVPGNQLDIPGDPLDILGDPLEILSAHETS